MTRSCPLPVDWLDYLDGVGEPELAEHLVGCRSCQALVASLRAETPITISTDWSKAFKGRTDAVWHEDRPANPAPAELWFSASDFELDELIVGEAKHGKTSSFDYHDVDRVLVLVLTHSDEDHAGWLDVVPVLSDVEAATETDFLLSEKENTLGAPWRALFAHQLKVARRQLDTRVGSLSERGATMLFAALSGEAGDTRWGVPVQHPDDPRARLEDELEEALRRLRTPWLLLHHSDDYDDEQPGDDKPALRLVVPEPAPEPPWGEESQQAGVFWLAPVGEPLHEFALAAASSPTARKHFWAVERAPLKLAGKLDVDWQRGLLIFVITTASLRHARRLRLHVVAAGKEYASEPFVPAQDKTVPLAKGVTTAQVDKLGAEVVT